MAEEIKKEAEPVVDVPAVEEPKEKSYDELKAEAEALEAQNKSLKTSHSEEEKAQNAARRLEKAVEENERLTTPKVDEKVSDTLDMDDLITLREQKFSKDSDEAKVLKQFKDAGIISDYESGLDDPGVQAKLAVIKADKDAKDIVDENDNSEAFLATKSEINSRYREKGEIPDSESQIKDLASSNLDEMGL